MKITGLQHVPVYILKNEKKKKEDDDDTEDGDDDKKRGKERKIIQIQTVNSITLMIFMHLFLIMLFLLFS